MNGNYHVAHNKKNKAKAVIYLNFNLLIALSLPKNGFNKEDIHEIDPQVGESGPRLKGQLCFAGARNGKFEIKRFQLYFQSLKQKTAPACYPVSLSPASPASLHSEKEFVMLPGLPLNDLDTSP